MRHNQKLKAAATALRYDEGVRLMAAQSLSEQLECGLGFLACAETLAEDDGARAVGALSATARLIRSNAALGAMILKAAQVETRRRTVSERIVEAVELNPKNSPKPEMSEKEGRKVRREFEYRMNRIMPLSKRHYKWTRPEDYPEQLDERDLDPSI